MFDCRMPTGRDRACWGPGGRRPSLFLSEGTLRNYVSSIFGKLGVTNRTPALIALRHGLIAE